MVEEEKNSMTELQWDMELLLSNTRESFMVVDRDFNIITFNHQLSKSYRSLFGKEVKKGDSVMNYALWDKQSLEDIFRKILAGGHHERELQVNTPNGELLYYSIQYTPARDRSGEIMGVFISSSDITLRKQANEKILLDKERYDLAAKATNDAIYDWDIVSNRLHWGEGFTTLFGYHRADDINKIESWIRCIHPDDIYDVVNSIRDTVYSTSLPKWESEYRFMKADGTYAMVLDRGFVIRNESGKPLRMIGAMQDVTLRRQNERTLQQLNEQLQKRASELVASNEELEQFAYIASHDLQEPLRMITGFLTRLEKKYHDQLDEKAQQYIWFAVDGAVRMRQIILDLLEYSRMGRADNNVEKIDTTELLKKVIQMHEGMIGESDAAIIVGDLPVIHASRVPMEHVFSNLISNAIKYRKEGVQPLIKISAEDRKDSWQFSVADNGIGIRQEFFHKIFVIFQRLHNKEEYSGTGVGLAICKKIVENHKGHIWVESEPEKGSTFYFTICK